MSFSNKLVSDKNGSRFGRMIHSWLFPKQELVADTPSRRDGMSYDEELTLRQKGGVFIFEVVMQLTHGKGEHGLSGVAATLFNRFFKFHSLRKVDYRDVAAACVFLAGKNEDSPKKLKYVVNQLWQFKFPHNKQFPSEKTFLDQCDVVTFLEEVVLRTISFDINIDLPHQYVLKLMQRVERGRNVYKEMVKTAYYMATDVLIVTDWSIRYSCAAIATACVNIAAFFHGIRMDDIVPKDILEDWYKFQDSSLTRAELEAMTREFIDIYSRNPSCHIGSLKKIDPHNKVKIIGLSPNAPQVSSSSVTASSSSSNLKKIDLESYKERQKTPSVTSTDSPRQSFLPDVKNQKVVERGLMEQKMKEREAAEKHHNSRSSESSSSSHSQHHVNGHHNGHHHSSSSVSSTDVRHQSQHGHNAQKSQSATTFSDHHKHQNHHSNSHHQYREDARSLKRPSGQEEPNGFRVKKTRMEYQSNFVAASSSSSSNGYSRQQMQMSMTTIQETANSSGISAYALGVSKMTGGPVPLMQIPVHESMLSSNQPSAYQKMCMDLENKRRPPSAETRAGLHHQHISPPESSPPISSTILLPPPPPPPVPPFRILDEMEEGELR